MLTFFNWQHGDKQPGKPYDRCSPNLQAVSQEMGKLFGGFSLGCYGVRPIRGGVAWSTHAFGAAIDWRIDDDKMRAAAIDWLVTNHELLGVQAIHDYVGCRIWHCDRLSWKTQPKSSNGMGQAWAKWLHIETNVDRWGDDSPVSSRFGPVPPAGKLITAATPAVPFPLFMGGTPDPARVRWLQQIMNERFGSMLKVDGGFGAMTKAAVIVMQGTLKVTKDGIYGQKSADALAAWLAVH